MIRNKLVYTVVLAGLIVSLLSGCNATGEPATSEKQDIRPSGWSKETHSNDADTDYDTVFPQDKVNRIKITIFPEDWELMQANLTEVLGVPGDGPGFREPGVPGILPDWRNMNPGEVPREGEAVPRAPGIPGWIDMTPENPAWVPATIEFNGLTWTNVGVRYKGNSSLNSGWNSGSLKLPLKLDFDEFEDEYPEIENQRFYGFKQLSLSNAFADATYMRDTIAADLLDEAGLVSAETAYYEVILEYGEGEVSLGLYVMIEVIDDTVIERYFDDDSGNIYEGDGPGVSLTEGTFNLIPNSFVKENNEQDADWSDIENLYDVLHSPERTSAPESWRESLESVFGVDVFLEWVAVSAVMQHWDTYGSMTHNFYLYHDPETGRLDWISWDHNQVLAGGGMGGGGGIRIPAGRMNMTVSFDKEEVGQNWPLIRHLLDDPVYYERYINYIEETIDGVFNPDKLEKECRQLAEIIGPYAVKTSTEASFKMAVANLIDRINGRYQAAVEFLATEGR